jgi:hypothetical protein
MLLVVQQVLVPHQQVDAVLASLQDASHTPHI